MTGRGLGYCTGNDRPGFQMDGPRGGGGFGRRGGGGGFGRGRGFGGGFGRGRGWTTSEVPPRPEPVPENQDDLRAEVSRLRHQIQALTERLDQD